MHEADLYDGLQITKVSQLATEGVSIQEVEFILFAGDARLFIQKTVRHDQPLL